MHDGHDTDAGPGVDAGLDDLAPHLEDWGGVAVHRFAATLSVALVRCAQYLDAQATRASDPQLTVAAARLARSRRHQLVDGFRVYMERRYTRACHPIMSPSAPVLHHTGASNTPTSPPPRLEKDFTLGALAATLEAMAHQDLDHLLGIYQRHPGLAQATRQSFPLAPVILEAALVDALREQPWPPAARALLLDTLRLALPEALAGTYGELTRDMTGINVGAGAPSSTHPTPVDKDDGWSGLALRTARRLAGLLRSRAAGMKTEASLEAPPEPAARANEHPSGAIRIRPKDLKVDTWLRIQEPGAPERELRLAWISPLRNLYLFSNRQGDRALSVNAEELDNLLRTGWARVIPPPDETGVDASATPQDDRRKRA